MIDHDREEALKEAYLKRKGFKWWDNGNKATMAMCLIQPSDRFFVAGASGMAGSAIVQPSDATAMANKPKAENYSHRADKSSTC